MIACICLLENNRLALLERRRPRCWVRRPRLQAGLLDGLKAHADVGGMYECGFACDSQMVRGGVFSVGDCMSQAYWRQSNEEQLR